MRDVITFNGRTYRPICQAFSRDRYYDGAFCLPEGLVARMYARYQDWLNRAGWDWATRDAIACQTEQGAMFKWWMVGYWIGKPILWLEKTATLINSAYLEPK